MCTHMYNYRLVPSTGRTKEFSVHSCKEAKEVLSSGPYLHSGVYWAQKQQVYSNARNVCVLHWFSKHSL